MEQDKVLDQLDERAQYLRQSEFLGPDYVPNSNAVFEEDQLHAEIVYLDDVTNPDVVVEAAQAESFEEVEDAVDNLTDVVEEGLDSLTSTILQQKEDAAVQAASTIKHFPIAVYGQPNFGDRVIDVETDNSDIVDGQKSQTTELVAIRDIMEDVLVEQREQRRFENAEDAEFSEIEDDMYKREQIMLLENMSDTLKDIERNGGQGGGGGGLFDSLLDMVGLGDKDKKGGKHNDNGVNRRGKKSGFFSGKGGKLMQGALAAGAALYVFDDFLWGDEEDPSDKGFIGAMGSAMFGDDASPEQNQIINETKEQYKEQLTTNNTTTQLLSQQESEASDSSPFVAGATALGGTLAIGAGYKKFMGEANPMMGTKGGLNAALHLPSLPAPSSNPVQSVMAKGGALAGEAASSSKGMLSKIPYLNLLLGGLGVYSTVTDDELTTSEKIADVAGVGGGYAGAAAGAAAMGSLGAAVGTVVPGLGNLIGGGLGGLVGGGLGYWGGEELVSSAMDWLLGNDRDAEPEELTAEQAASTAQPEWWESEPTETSDGKVIAGDKTFPDMKTFRKMQDQKIRTETTKANASGVAEPTTVTRVNGEVVTDIDEAQVETTAASAEATLENSSALDKLTKAIDDAGLGLTGLGTIAGSAKTAWEWAKGVFGFGDDEKEVTAETAVTQPVNIEAQLAQQYGDAAVDTVETATKPKIKEYKTSAAMYETAESTAKTVEKVSHTNATLKEAVSAIKTYSETQRGYDNWIDDFGKTDVTYDQYLSYFNKGSAQPQFVGGDIVTPKSESTSETTTEVTDKQLTQEQKVVDTMDGVTPQSTKTEREINWTPKESPWHDWSKTHSDYDKFSDQGEAVRTENVPYRIEQSPVANVEVAPASTDVKHTNFVEARHTILDTGIDVQNSANVSQSDKVSTEKAARKTTRENIKTRPANRAAGKTARPTISSVPIIVDDSGMTALNLGYL